MMANKINVECSGLLIRCFVASVQQLNIFPQNILESKVAALELGGWYDIRHLTEILQSLTQLVPVSSPIYFQAGVQLANIINKQAQTNEQPQQSTPLTAHEWLNANIRNAQCCTLTAHDAQSGDSTYECATILPLEYIKGYFYGRYTHCQFEYVDVKSANANVVDIAQGQSESIHISVRYAVAAKPNLVSVHDKLKSDYIDEISLLLKDALTKQLENTAIVGRLNEELIEQRDRIARLANHDPVTGLASLRLGRDRLRMACNNAKRNNVKAAVMLIDLDGFKQANSQYGHLVGDAILKTVAERISKSIRATDSAVRQSGDSFLIILSAFNEIQSLAIVAKRIISAISDPISYEVHTFNIACNIGIAVYPDDTDAVEQMIKCADKAIHTIKKTYKNQFAFYENAN